MEISIERIKDSLFSILTHMCRKVIRFFKNFIILTFQYLIITTLDSTTQYLLVNSPLIIKHNL